MDRRKYFVLIIIVLISIAVFLVAPWVGTHRVEWRDLWGTGNPLAADIFWKIRLPRILTAFLAGCGLALGGASFQAMFRNPLAEPFTLGVSAGASAGVALALYLGGGVILAGTLSLENVFAFSGALLAIGVVYAFSRLKSDFSCATLLLAGVAVSFFFSSLIMLLQHLVDPHNAARIFRAMIGGIAAAGRRQFFLAFPFVLLGAALTAAHCRELDIMSCGEEVALTRGVDTGRVRRRLFIGVSLMVGGITALCGPVGFVGLVSPHICRILVGPGHRLLLPASAVFGGAFLVLADLTARTVLAPAELPVGVVSSLCGSPFFLWLLLKADRE
ncbi:MAG: iron ABC transporter permease [Planctomycetes bacterium]|nr:iron ABC transporter permease [Planctomycetota bacterium]